MAMHILQKLNMKQKLLPVHVISAVSITDVHLSEVLFKIPVKADRPRSPFKQCFHLHPVWKKFITAGREL